MRVIDFNNGVVNDSPAGINSFDHLQWIDYTRGENWILGDLEPVLHGSHLEDLKNASHPPYFEQTDDYEMIIFRARDQRFEITEPRTRAIAFVLCQNTLLTFRDKDDTTLSPLFERFSKQEISSQLNILSLTHELLDCIVDGFLDMRESLQIQVGAWQQRLLDPNDPLKDWSIVMQAKSGLGRLNTNLELQMEMLSTWQETSRHEINSGQQVRFNDLSEHLARMISFSSSMRKDLDSLTQVYFAASGQQTNNIVQFLAVISAIFLPLNLIAGLFGMNFQSIPFLGHPWGPYVVIALMFVLAIALLWWFRKRRWF